MHQIDFFATGNNLLSNILLKFVNYISPNFIFENHINACMYIFDYFAIT